MQVRQACASAILLALGLALAPATSSAQSASGPSASAKPATVKPATVKPAPGKPAQGQQKPGPQATTGQAEGVAAVVNDEVISTFDVRQRSALILASSGIAPSSESMRQVRSQALRGLVDERLQVQEATEKKIELKEEELDEAIENIAKSNNLTVPQFKRQLEMAGAGIATLRRQIGAEIMWRRLINGRYGSRVRISPVEVQETLARIEANASKPQYQMSEILLQAETPQEFADAETAATRLLQEMRGGKVSFAAVARQFSSAPSAAAGGDLGWLSEGELRPELQAAAKALRPGQVSAPIRTDAGIVIVALRDARDGVDARAAMRVKLVQITAPATSRAALERAKARIRGCNGIPNAIKNVPDAQVVDLGEMAEADLNDAMRAKVSETSINDASALFDAANGVATVVVCNRGSAGGIVPSRDQIEDRLYEEELAMLSQRYLMDLRRDSTIITR